MKPHVLVGLRPPLVLLVLGLTLAGCPSPQAAKTDSVGPHPQRSTVGVVAHPSTHAVTVGNGGGSTGPSASSPTLRPATADPNHELPSLEPGQSALALGPEPKLMWGQAPYLVRPRMAMAAGAVGKALIVAEGENRASLEVYDPTKASDWQLDTRHDLENPDGIHTHDHGGGLLFAAGAVYKDELWTAGGNDGQLQANGEAGITQLFLYRAASGFARKRQASEGTRQLKLPTRAAAAGVIDKFMYVAGGVFIDTKMPIPAKNGGGEQLPVARTELQRVNLTNFDDADLRAPLPLGVASAASVVYNDHLYLIGGYTYDATGAPVVVKTVQEYNPTTDTWLKSGDADATVPELPAEIHSAAAALTAHTLYLAGGIGADGKVRNSFYYFDFNDPATPRKWKEAPLMPTARAMLALTAFQDGLWAIGGVGADGQALRTVEKFFTEIPKL